MTPKEIRGLATRLENTGWRAEAPYLREKSEKAAKALNAFADLVEASKRLEHLMGYRDNKFSEAIAAIEEL